MCLLRRVVWSEGAGRVGATVEAFELSISGAVRCGAAYGAHSAVVRRSTYPILQQRLDGMGGVDCWCLQLSSNSSVVAEASLSVSSMSCCCLETARKYRRTGSRDGVESHTSHSLYSIDGIPRDHYEIGLQLSLPYLMNPILGIYKHRTPDAYHTFQLACGHSATN